MLELKIDSKKSLFVTRLTAGFLLTPIGLEMSAEYCADWAEVMAVLLENFEDQGQVSIAEVMELVIKIQPVAELAA